MLYRLPGGLPYRGSGTLCRCSRRWWDDPETSKKPDRRIEIFYSDGGKLLGYSALNGPSCYGISKGFSYNKRTMESAMVPFFAPLAIRRINNLRAVNTLNSSTPVASTSISFIINYLRGFCAGSYPPLATCFRSAVSADGFSLRTIQCTFSLRHICSLAGSNWWAIISAPVTPPRFPVVK